MPLQYSCLENPRDGGAWWLPSMGWHRVGHDWSDLAVEAAAMSLLFNMLSTLVIAFLPGSKCLLISLQQSPFAEILEPPENKICHFFHCFHIYLPWSDGTRCHDLKFFECWILSQPFHSRLSLSSRGSLVPFHFLPQGLCHLHIWGYWYFPWLSWFYLHFIQPGSSHDAVCI